MLTHFEAAAFGREEQTEVTHRLYMRAAAGLTALLITCATGCQQAARPEKKIVQPESGPAPIPRPDHVVVVIEENRTYNQIIGSADAPFINQLARDGALMTDAHGVAHPSQPNYLALFSGSTQGLHNDSCPHTFDGPNLAVSLRQKGLTFGGYSESLPAAGFTGCQNGPYARKHNPWVNFTNVDASVNIPFTAFPSDYTQLPTVSFVVPNLNNDMHDGSVATADQWLKRHLADYLVWAQTHNSLLILTWDEDNMSTPNHIPTIFVGAHVKSGTYAGRVDHTSLLRTIEAMYGLSESTSAQPIADIWK